MKIDLTDTTASKINKALVQGRRAIGTPAVGMVLTLVIVTDEENAYDALKAAERRLPRAPLAHPGRHQARLAARPRDRTQSRLDAEVRVGADAGTGETVVLRLYGEVADHAQSVVLPLLLPDAPVVVWWPVDAPARPGRGPAGRARPAPDHRHATPPRTRSASCGARAATLRARATPTWPGPGSRRGARCWPPRSTRQHCEVTSASRGGRGRTTRACELLALWLADRLEVPVERVVSAGPGLTAVRLETERRRDRAWTAPDGSLATLSLPGQPDRAVALKRRDTSELIAEELRRLDPDDMYAVARCGSAWTGWTRQSAAGGPGGRSPAPARPTAPAGRSRRRSRRGRGAAPAEAAAGQPGPAKATGGTGAVPPVEEGGVAVSTPQLVVHRDKELMAQAAAARLITKIVDAQAARGSASVVLTGGRNGNGLLAALAAAPGPGRGRLGAGSTCGGATSGSCPRATRSATSPRPARRCWTRCRWTRRGCTPCPRPTARTAPTWRRRRRRTRRSWPRAARPGEPRPGADASTC